MNETSNVSSLTKPLKTVEIFQLVCYNLIVIIGIVGNSLICLAVLGQHKRKPCEYFILNLAITDLATSTVSVPLDIIEKLAGYFPYGSFFCNIIYPFQTIIMAVSIATLIAMSLERHRAIIHPLKPRIQTKMTLFIIFLFWVLSAVLVSPYIIVLKYDGTSCRGEWPGEEYIKAYTLLLFILLYVLPLLMISITYARIGRKLYEGTKKLKDVFTESVQSNTGRLIMIKRARRNNHIVKIFVTAVLAFAVCMLPNHIIWLWYDFGNVSNSSVFFQILPFGNILVYANSCINPFIFGTLQTQQCCMLKGMHMGEHQSPVRRGRFSVFSLRFSFSSSSRQRSVSLSSTSRVRSVSRQTPCYHFVARDTKEEQRRSRWRNNRNSRELKEQRMESVV